MTYLLRWFFAGILLIIQKTKMYVEIRGLSEERVHGSSLYESTGHGNGEFVLPPPSGWMLQNIHTGDTHNTVCGINSLCWRKSDKCIRGTPRMTRWTVNKVLDVKQRTSDLDEYDGQQSQMVGRVPWSCNGSLTSLWMNQAARALAKSVVGNNQYHWVWFWRLADGTELSFCKPSVALAH